MMKLKKVLKYFDAFSGAKVIIWVIPVIRGQIAGENATKDYEGDMFDIPWTIVDYRLAEPDENDGDEAIFVGTDDDGKTYIKDLL